MPVSIAGDGTITGFDAGASGFGGLVAVKHVLKTDTFSSSVSAGGNVAVTDLSITHALSDSANKLIISAYFGMASTTAGRGNVGLAVMDDSTLIAVGDTAGSRERVGGISIDGGSFNFVTGNHGIMFVYEPGDTASHTYTVRAVNPDSSTETVYINRTQVDTDALGNPRGSSGLVIQEVAV